MKKEKKQKNSKYKLLKVIGIAFLLFVILTWFIPSGVFSGSSYSEFADGTSPIGLFGLFQNPLYSFGIFAQYFLVFLAIGGFYGVLNKTGAYSKIVEKITKLFKKHKTLCLILTIILFALLTSLVGNPIVMFIFVPYALTILMNVGYKKVTSLAATVGSILVGLMGSIFGTDVVFISFLNLEPFTGIVTKIIFFVLITTVYILFLLFKNGNLRLKKKNKKIEETAIEKEEIEIPLYEHFENEKSIIPLFVILILVSLFILVGTLNWEYNFGITFFQNLYTSITEISWLSKILGTLPVVGYFGNYDIAATLLLVTFIIKWVYSIKFDEFIDSFVNGAKVMLKPAIYVILASTIFAVMVNNSYNISATITNWFLGLNESLFTVMFTLIGYVGGFFFNDFPYLINSMYGALATFDSSNYTIMSILLQSGYSLAMLSLPVSVVLIAGLKYLNVSYKEWMKYIYQFLLIAFVLIIAFALIIMAI